MFRVIPPSGRSDSKDNLDPNLYEYEVIDEEKKRQIVAAEKISRAKGVLNKDKIKLFVRQHVTSPKRCNRVIVKTSSKQKFCLNEIQWTHLFAGPEPVFENNLNETSEPIASTSGCVAITKKNSKTLDKGSQGGQSNKKSKKIDEEERRKQKEIEEKLAEKERLDEWNKKRDDLACDDLQPLPEPLPIKCRIPTNLFSDSLLVMEFFHSFNELFDIKPIFPMGITLELMEKILFDKDVDGPFVDLIKVLLTSNFTFLDEQDNNDSSDENSDNSSDEDERHLKEEGPTDSILNEGERTSKFYYQWIQSHLGSKLSKINLDAFTMTEVLRLYLLSSGGAPEDKSRRSYKSREDPAIEFVATNPSILSKLKSDSIFDLNPDERLKIFHVLIHQLLSFFELREKIDDSFEEMTKLRKKIRDIQMEFNKWTKDNKPLTKKELQIESQKSNNSTTDDRNVYRKEKSEKEEEKFRVCSEVRSQIRKLQACYGLKPIGLDRAFRVYWLFESLPALFVEHVRPNTDYTSLPFGPCLSVSTPKTSFKPLNVAIEKKESHRDDSSTTSDKENEMNSFTEPNTDKELFMTCRMRPFSVFDKCTANLNTCAVHGNGSIERKPEWAFYHTEEQVECLLRTLNIRGHRESSLKFTLNRDKSIVLDYINRCQPYKLNSDIPPPEISRRSQRLQEVLHTRKRKASIRQDLNVAFVTTLKEDLLSLEDKLHAASLLVNTSRDKWLESLEKISFDKNQCIEDVTNVMLTLKARVRPMCLSASLIEENWTQGLADVSSISQLFIYLSVLDDNIKWSKSAREAYCKICRRKHDAQNMLLCDQCNRGHHIYCLQPSLDSIPNGEWFCPDCCPKNKPQSPKKEKKTKFHLESEYESSDDDSDQSDEGLELSPDSSANSGQENETCDKCLKRVSSSGEQLSCAKCHNTYHLKCSGLKRITRSEWFCQKCSNSKTGQKRKAIMMDLDSDSEIDDSFESDRRQSKRLRSSVDSDYISDKSFKETKGAKIATTTSSRRRLCRQSLPLDFGLCEDILKKLQKHPESYFFRSRPNQVIETFF